MLITNGYREENRRQHEMNNGYGIGGYRHLQNVLELAGREKCQTVLDYGCGQATLSKHARRVSPLKFFNYDPAIQEYSATPPECDLVVCTDVLEHIEPDCLFEVLSDIASKATKAVFLEIAIRPAKRILSDGTNAHKIIRPPYFWFDTIRDFFDITEFVATPGYSVQIVGVPEGKLWT